MNKKEVGEIRRRFRRDRCNMRAVYGCYVRSDRQIISEFRSPMGTLSENEADKYMALFKKTLGGALGKTLNNISFPTRQVAQNEERYETLTNLRRQALEDPNTRNAFYRRVIESLNLDFNYLILLGCDTYDVPFKNKKGDTDNDAGGNECFTYIICSICPVKETKPNLHYVHAESTFHDGGMIQAVNAPIAGFMFPAFDDRSTNVYGALYFNKDTSDSREAFVDAVFGVVAPTAADKERGAFSAILRSTLGDECNIDIVHALHAQARQQEQLHAEARSPETLTVDRANMEAILTSCGVTCETVSKFGEAFADAFGSETQVPLHNIIDTKHYTVTAPEVVIKIAPDKAQNVERRTIGGLDYIMILADGDVEVNGVQLAPPNKG